MHQILPGIGFGSVVLGAARSTVEAALGQPASVHALDDLQFLNFPAAGVQVVLDSKSDVVSSLYLFDAARFARSYGATALPADAFASFTGTTADGLGIGASEADIAARLGPPTKTEKNADGRWLYYPALGLAIAVSAGTARQLCIDTPTAPRARQTAPATSVVARDLDWYEDLHENINSREFARVWHAEGDLRLTAAAAAELLGQDDAALVVEGDLIVDGHLRIDDHHAVHVDGNLTCDSLWIAAGVLACADLTATRWFEFPLDDTQRIETLDISSLTTRILACPNIEPDDLAPSVEYEHLLSIDAASPLLADHHDAVLAALRDGEDIDDDWVLARFGSSSSSD